MNDRGRFNNVIITISVLLNVILTVMLIILLGQTGSGKKEDPDELTGQPSIHEYADEDSVFVLQTDDFDITAAEQAEDLTTTAAPTTTTTTTVATTTESTTTTVTTTTTTTAPPVDLYGPTQPTLIADDGTSEDEGDWLDIWGMN